MRILRKFCVSLQAKNNNYKKESGSGWISDKSYRRMKAGKYYIRVTQPITNYTVSSDTAILIIEPVPTSIEGVVNGLPNEDEVFYNIMG